MRGNAKRLSSLEPVREFHHPGGRVLAAVVDRDVGAELECLLEARVGEIDRDDATRCVQLRRHDRRETDRSRPDDRDGVAGLDPAVENADLIRRRQDVGEEQHLLVAERIRHLVDGRIGERHSGELGLQPVDQVPEDPAAATRAEAVLRLLAEAAASAGGDARDEHAIAGHDGRHSRADLDDRADGLVAEDRSRLHLGHVALEDVQVGAADSGRVDPDDRVGRLENFRVGNDFPCPLARSVVDEGFHVVDLRLSLSWSLATAVAGFIGGDAHRSFRFSRKPAAGDTPMLLGFCLGMLETRGGEAGCRQSAPSPRRQFRCEHTASERDRNTRSASRRS